MKAEIKKGESTTMNESHLIEYLKFIQERFAPEGIECNIKVLDGEVILKYSDNYTLQPVISTNDTLKKSKWCRT